MDHSRPSSELLGYCQLSLRDRPAAGETADLVDKSHAEHDKQHVMFTMMRFGERAVELENQASRATA